MPEHVTAAESKRDFVAVAPEPTPVENRREELQRLLADVDRVERAYYRRGLPAMNDAQWKVMTRDLESLRKRMIESGAWVPTDQPDVAWDSVHDRGQETECLHAERFLGGLHRYREETIPALIAGTAETGTDVLNQSRQALHGTLQECLQKLDQKNALRTSRRM